MNDVTKRVALLIRRSLSELTWITLDQTGQPPRVLRDLPDRPEYGLASPDDAPLAVYVSDEDMTPNREQLAAISELVKVSRGLPNVSVDVDAQMAQLRGRIDATEKNANELLADLSAELERERHRVGRIIAEARGWKRYARARENMLEKAYARADKLEREARDNRDLKKRLEVSAAAVERSVARSNHSNELVEAARRERDAAKVDASTARLEATAARREAVELQAEALRTIIRVSQATPEPDDVPDAEIVEPAFTVRKCFAPDDTPVLEVSTSLIEGPFRIDVDGYTYTPSEQTLDASSADSRFRHMRDSIAKLQQQNWDGSVALTESRETISRQIDTIRELEAERDLKALQAAGLNTRAIAWDQVYRHRALQQYANRDGLALENILGGITHMAETIQTVQEKLGEALIENTKLDRDRADARSDNQRLRGILAERGVTPEADRTEVNTANAAAKILGDKLTDAQNENERLQLRLTQALDDSANELERAQERSADLEQERTDILRQSTQQHAAMNEHIHELEQERDTLRARLTHAQHDNEQLHNLNTDLAQERETLRASIERERETYTATSTGLRRMIEQRDELITAAEDLAQRTVEAGTGGPSSGDLLAARQINARAANLPKLQPEQQETTPDEEKMPF